jgi:hypothetical protein
MTKIHLRGARKCWRYLKINTRTSVAAGGETIFMISFNCQIDSKSLVLFSVLLECFERTVKVFFDYIHFFRIALWNSPMRMHITRKRLIVNSLNPLIRISFAYRCNAIANCTLCSVLTLNDAHRLIKRALMNIFCVTSLFSLRGEIFSIVAGLLLAY